MNTTEKSHSICRLVIHHYGQCVSTGREMRNIYTHTDKERKRFGIQNGLPWSECIHYRYIYIYVQYPGGCMRCVQTQGEGGRRKKRVFIIYTRVYIHYDDVRLFSLHSWWVYYITGPSITSAINSLFIINMLIVFCGTPKNSENGVEPKFLLWIQGTNKRWTTG